MTVALGWIVLGVAIAIGAFRMDRLAQMNIEPWSAPGLVPGLLGVLIAVFGAVLAWRERGGAAAAAAAPESGAAAGPAVPDDPDTPSPRAVALRIGAVLVLCAVFVFGLLGRGLPFVATASALVFAWIAMLRLPEWRAAGTVARGLAGAAAIALGACFTIAHLFQDLFLVRLP
ncbi:MAG: tripartite tricarboxylate transporter TctB family protein [Burkholderiales bacterium]|nr:tripartite tricarboxylate transporter TctB family protein [Burkholderiales bacterium]